MSGKTARSSKKWLRLSNKLAGKGAMLYLCKAIRKLFNHDQNFKTMKITVKITHTGRASCSCAREDCTDGIGTGSAEAVAADGRAYFLPFMAKMGLSPYKEGQQIAAEENDLFLKTIKNNQK